MYVFRKRGVTIHPPYKKLRPRNFDKGKMNTGETRIENERMIKWDIYERLPTQNTKDQGNGYSDILKVPALDTGLHILLLLRLMPLPPCCRLDLCHDQL